MSQRPLQTLNILHAALAHISLQLSVIASLLLRGLVSWELRACMYRYTERKYGLPITPSTIMQELPLVVKRSAPSADIKTPRGMFLMILWLFALSQNNETAATPRHVDDVILKFITDASPVLFPPPRILLHSCIDHGKTLKLTIYVSDEINGNCRRFPKIIQLSRIK